MRKQKNVYLLFALMVTLVLGFITACGSKDSESKKDIAIKLNYNEITLDFFEEKTLTATVEGTDEKIVWSSSNSDVVTVTEGLVEPKGVGEATITATVDDKSDTCKVKVIDSGEVPKIKVTNKTVDLLETNTFQLDAKVVYKNNEIVAPLFYSSENESVATVSDTGLILAGSFNVENDSTNIIISSTYKGYELTNTHIKVTIKEDVSIILDKNNIELASYKTEDIDFPTSDEVKFTITSKGEEINKDVEINVSYSDDGIVNYDPKTNKVTAISKGYTRVTLEFISDKGSKLQAYFDVDVYAPTIIEPKYNFNIDANFEEVKLNLHAELVAEDIISIKDEKENNVLKNVDKGQVVFDKAKLLTGEKTYIVEFPDRFYQVEVIVATRFLNNKSDFDWFMKMLSDKASACPAGKDTRFATGEYYLLTSNIDCSNTVYLPWEQRGNFDGVFNGGGYTISNMDMPRQGFIRICTGIIKNVSFYNATYNKGNNAALVCNELLDKAQMTNVFVHGKVTNNHSKSFAGLVNYIQGNCILSNCISIVDLSKVGGKVGSLFVTNRGKVDNCYGISEAPSHAENTGVFNGKSYTTVDNMINEFKLDKKLLETFDTSMWNIEKNIPLMHSFIDNIDVKNTMDISTLPKDTKIKLTNNSDPLVKYSLLEQVVGVSIDGNMLNITNEAVLGSEINIVVTSIFDETKKDTIKITISSPVIDYTSEKSVGDLVKNGGIGADGFVKFADINSIIGESSLTKEKVTKVVLNNVETNATIEEDKIIISKSDVASDINGYVNLDIHTEDGVYRFKVMAVYAAIGSVNDLSEFFKNITKDYCSGETIILTNDLDCSPANYKDQNNQVGGNKATFSGTFDGRGHAIKNIKVGYSNNRRALFRVVNKGAVIKNLALIDTKVGFSTAYYPAAIASEMYGTVSNCFVSGTNETKKNSEDVNAAGGIVNQINNESIVENCISAVEFSGTAENNALIVGDFRTDRKGKNFANCYGISSTATKMVGNEQDFVTSNLQLFNNINDFGNKVSLGLEGEGWSEYWQIKENKLYFGNNIVLDWGV